MASIDTAARRGDPTIDSAARVRVSLLHREPDRLPLDIGGTRVSGVHVRAYQRFREALGLPPSKPRMQILYLQLPKVEEDFRSLLGVDLESVDPATSAFEGEVRAVDPSQGGGRGYLDMWGCQWYMPPGGEYFDLKGFPLANAETVTDVEGYSWPKGNAPELIGRMTAEAREAWTGHRRAVALGRTCPGIYEMCSILCGHEKAIVDMAINPGLSEAIMDRVLQHKIEYYSAVIPPLLEGGLPYVIASESDDLGSQNNLLISPEMYRGLVKPRHEKLFQAVKRIAGGRAFVELHSCGAVRAIIGDFVESGVDILNPVQVSASGMDPRELKRDFGGSVVFHGGGVDSQYTLPHGTPAEVRDEVRRRIEDLAPGGGFIFTPVHSIQSDVPVANFMAMLEAFYEYA